MYLTQANHSSYKGRNSQEQLRQSVRLLYSNYNDIQRDDVIFMHTGDIAVPQQESLLRLCANGTARFHELAHQHFAVPEGLKVPSSQWKYRRKFSTGYRHMIRLFTVGLWDIIERLGYDYVMRLDEDSYIWSPIRYNIFQLMHDQDLEYVYRLASWERGHVAGDYDGFHRFVRTYAHEQRLHLHWLLGSCEADHSALNSTSFSFPTCGNMYTIYNNSGDQQGW